MKNNFFKNIFSFVVLLSLMGASVPANAQVAIYSLPSGGTVQTGDAIPIARCAGTGCTYKVNVGSAATFNSTAFLQTSNNLSDLQSAPSARTNLGLGSAATFPSTSFLLGANNLSDLANITTARTNLGLGSASLLATSGVLQPSNNLSDVSNATSALTNLLPSQTGQAGKVFGTNGTVGAWVSASGSGTVTTTGTPAAGNLTKFSGASAVTNGDLAGDCTTNGTLSITCTKTNGSNFAASATTDTTVANNLTSGTLPAGRIPNPSASSLGGVQSLALITHNFMTGISTLGVPTYAQPAASDITGLATSATTDTTNASNITSGTLPAARLPNPSPTTLGGIQSTTGAANNFLTSISTLGVPSFAQPSFANISGSVTGAQLPNPSSTTLGGVQSIASATNNFLTGISTSGVPSQAQPAFTNLSGNISVNQMNSGTSASSTTCWYGDGSWKACGGAVSLTAATPNLVFTPSPITGTGTIGITSPINAQGATTPYSIVSGDMGKTVTNSKATAVAVTLAQAGTTGFESGKAYTELNLNDGAVTITPTTSTINGNASQILHKYGWHQPISDGTNYSSIGFPGFGTITSGAMTKFTSDASGATTAAAAGTDYQAPITLTTTGSSGAATLISNTLNIPNYAGGGGGVFNYSNPSSTLTAGTYFVPIGGSGTPTTTEANVNVKAPAAITASNLQVGLSVAPASGQSAAITLRVAGSDTALTCTISNTATNCQDLTHSVNIAQNDLIDWKVVTTGTYSSTPTVNISAAAGTSSVGVTSVSVTTANGVSGSVATATTTPAITLTLGNITPGTITSTGAISSTPSALTISGAAVATNAALSNYFYVTLSHLATTTVSNPTNPTDGQNITYEFTQDGTGSNLVTWGTAFDTCAAGTPTLSTAAGKVDMIGWRYSARLSKWLIQNGSGLGC